MEMTHLPFFSSDAAGSRLSRFLGRVVDACILLSVGLIPLWFLPFTLDVLELNKQTLMVMLMMVGLIAWLGKAVVDKSLSLRRSWMHLVVVLFGVGYLITSLFSQDRYLSLVGNYGQMQWAFVSVAAFIVLYLLIVNRTKGTTGLYNSLLAFLGSSVAVGIYGFLQIIGMFPFGGIAASKSFNSIGSVNSLAVFMAVPLVVAASLMVLGCKDNVCILGRQGKGSAAAKALVWLTIVLSVAVAVVVDFWVAWAAILFGMVLLVAISVARTRKVGHPSQIVIPAVLSLLSMALLIWSTPVSFGLPPEVSPNGMHSWAIAKQVMQDHPLFGSGPGTWIYDYAQYRAPSVNLSQFWTIRFERGLSTFFTLFATVGLVGIALWIILLLSAIVMSASHLIQERDDDAWQAYLTVFTGWATMAFISFFYNYNFSHHFVFWFLLALLGSLVAKGSVRWDAQKSAASSGLLSLLFVVLAVAAVSVAWLAGQRLAADAKYSAAVTAFRSGKPIQTAIDDLNAAVTLNKLNDVYYRNLSQAYLIRVGQVYQAAATPERARQLEPLVRAAIDTGTRATTIDPMNVDNWSNLAVVYQAIASFYPGADEFALKNFQEALKREPNNPIFYDEMGKIYILRSDAYRTLLSSKDATVRANAENNVKNELEKAASALNQSIQVKPDYAPAHYDLGILYERQGRLKDAVTKLEQVLKVNNKDVGVGFQLAILYYRNGEKIKASDLLTQITRMEPNYANARWYLSVLLEEQGQYDEAIAQVQQVELMNPNHQEIKDRLLKLTQERDANSKPASQPLPAPVREDIKGPAPLNAVSNP